MLHMLIYFVTIVWILLCIVVLFFTKFSQISFIFTNCSEISKWSFNIFLSLLQTELFLCYFVLFNKRLFSPDCFITNLNLHKLFRAAGLEGSFHLPRVILITFCHCMCFINLFIKWPWNCSEKCTAHKCSPSKNEEKFLFKRSIFVILWCMPL